MTATEIPISVPVLIPSESASITLSCREVKASEAEKWIVEEREGDSDSDLDKLEVGEPDSVGEGD
jgi:hypothetical protein